MTAQIPNDDSAYSMYDLYQWYKNPQIVSLSGTKDEKDAYDQLVSRLKEYGEGARGIITGVWNAPPYTQGHAVAWQVINSEATFLDGQANKIYDDPYDDLFSGFLKDETRFARLDNLEVRMKGIKEAVKDGRT